MPASPDLASLAAVVATEDLRTAIDARLTQTGADLRRQMTEAGAAAARLADGLDVMLAGGKRLRAAFLYWSWRAHGGAPDSQHRDVALDLGTALELFQAAALFHDDVIDRSDRRRNQPAAHVTLAEDHRVAHWDGDAEHYGVSGAILLGDLALVASGELLGRALAELRAHTSSAVRSLWTQMAVEVTAGQFLDIHAQAVPWGKDPAVDERRAREVVLAKTARYSVELPLAMGAAVTGASPEVIAQIREVGRPLGEAFQLRDDVLGMFGDPALTGKPAGDDIREGKRTVLIARAAAGTDEADFARLATSLGDAALTPEGVRDVQDIVERSGARAAVEALITELYDEARHALAQADLAQPGAAMLSRLAEMVVTRTA